jgi:hypothetical protein
MLFQRTNTVILDRGIAEGDPQLPRGVTIQEARLVLAVLGPIGDGVEVKIGRILQPWDPLVATWELRTATEAWAQPGGREGTDFSPFVGHAASVLSGTTPASPVTMSFDVTQDLERSQRQHGATPGWLISGTARLGGVRNLQLRSSPALAVKYSGAQAAIRAGLVSGGF